MRLVIFGATGSTGSHLVREALSRGHEITVFTRREAIFPSGVRVERGNVLDPAAVRRAVQGQDAVLVALGAPVLDRSGLREKGTQTLVEAMIGAGVDRIVCMGCLGTGDSYAALDWFTRWVVLGVWLRFALADHEGQERVLRESPLDWTVVRPPHLTGEDQGTVTAAFPVDQPPPSMSVGTVDLARYMLDCAEDGRHSQRAIGVCAA